MVVLNIHIAISDKYDAVEVGEEFELYLDIQSTSSGYGFGYRDMEIPLPNIKTEQDIADISTDIIYFFEQNDIPILTRDKGIGVSYFEIVNDSNYFEDITGYETEGGKVILNLTGKILRIENENIPYHIVDSKFLILDMHCLNYNNMVCAPSTDIIVTYRVTDELVDFYKNACEFFDWVLVEETILHFLNHTDHPEYFSNLFAPVGPVVPISEFKKTCPMSVICDLSKECDIMIVSGYLY